MIKSDNGYGVAAPMDDGGFSSIGNGASRALPAGGWVTAGCGRCGGPPTPTPLAIGPDYNPSDPTGSGSGTAGTSAPTDSQSLIDLFKVWMGGSGNNKPADSGAVVVYGDAAGGAPSAMSPIAKLLIGGAVIGGGIWAWKKYA